MSTNSDTTLKTRLAPFWALLDARYSPLICAALPQAYTVYRWLYSGSDRSAEAWVFAIIGALGFEMIYVGAIAWSEVKGKTQTAWFWLTALTALIFSVLVALRVYLPHEAEWAILHSGFPIVAFSYTMLIHKASASAPEKESAPPHTEQWQRWQEWGAAMQSQLTAMQNRLASERSAFASERAALVAEFEQRLDAAEATTMQTHSASGAVLTSDALASGASDAIANRDAFASGITHPTLSSDAFASGAPDAILTNDALASGSSDATRSSDAFASGASDAILTSDAVASQTARQALVASDAVTTTDALASQRTLQQLLASDATLSSDALALGATDATRSSDALASGAADGGTPSPDFFRLKFQQQPSVALLQEALLGGVTESTLKSWVQRYAKQWKWAEVAPQVRQALAMQAY